MGSMGVKRAERSRKYRAFIEGAARRIFGSDPTLSLKKLAGEIKKETGIGTSNGTLSPIYQKLREETTCRQ